MKHRPGLAASLWLVTLAVPLSAWAEPGPPPTFTTLAPGQVPRIEQNLDVNVVFIGFRQGAGPQEIDDARFRSLLTPFSAVAAAEVLALPPFEGRVVPGILSRLRYRIVYAPPSFENGFFGFLRSRAQRQEFPSSFGPGTPSLPVVPAQYFYDFCNVPPAFRVPACDFDPLAPHTNRRFITQNHFIYAPIVERSLALNLPFIGVDPSRPTLVLINWFGRPDFIDHVYFKNNEPDVDTGFDYLSQGDVGLNFTSGWGGTARDDPEDSRLCPTACPLTRLMFLDLSAGPTILQGDWDLLGELYRLPGRTFGGPEPDYRLPPIWEYGNVGYRPFDDLTGDLGLKVVSDVFIGAVATANPAYPPALSPPRTPSTIQVDVNLFQWNPPIDTSGLLNQSVLVRILGELPYRFTSEFTKATPRQDDRLQDVWQCILSILSPDAQSCYGGRLGGSAEGDLYFYFRDHLFQFLEGDPDYELPVFIFDTDDAHQQFFQGLADSNNADNLRQAFVYLSSSPQNTSGRPFTPSEESAGYTHLLAHEVGHHLGLSHPFHGYRCLDEECQDLRFFHAVGSTYYTRLGDQLNSVMAYNHLNRDFSQFDRDNLSRFLTFEYLRLANEILASVLGKPSAEEVYGSLVAADGLATDALTAFGALDYATAVQRAEAAYRTVLAAADQLHVPLDPGAWQRDYRHPADVRKDLREALKRMLIDPPLEQDQAGLTDLLNGATLTTPDWSFLPNAPTSAPIPVFSPVP